MLRILIVDDHPAFREGIKRIILDAAIAEIIDEASNCKQTLKKIRQQAYDVVLLDIGLPDGSGIDLCKIMHESDPSLKILAITSYGEYSCIQKMMDNGAWGYILKNSMPEEILEGIQTIMEGEEFLCHEAGVLMKKQKQSQVFLTPRETELLQLIVQGYTNPEIAEILFLGIETINSYRKNLLFKLNAKNTAVLVKMALEQKLI